MHLADCVELNLADDNRGWCVFEQGMARFAAAIVQGLVNDGLNLTEFGEVGNVRSKVIDISHGEIVPRQFDIVQPREELKFAKAQLEKTSVVFTGDKAAAGPEATRLQLAEAAAAAKRDKKQVLKMLTSYAKKIEPKRSFVDVAASKVLGWFSVRQVRKHYSKQSQEYDTLCKSQIEKLKQEARFELMFEDKETYELMFEDKETYDNQDGRPRRRCFGRLTLSYVLLVGSALAAVIAAASAAAASLPSFLASSIAALAAAARSLS